MQRTLTLCAAIAAAITICPAQDNAAESTQPTPSVSGGDRWGANYFPNIELTNQDGTKLHFFDDCIKGKVVLLSFIYTSCPDACPLETARIAEVQGILGDRVGKDVFFYSITIDPEKDTPAVLKEYAQRYQAGPGWQFLTGNLREIENLRLKLGMFDPDLDTKLSDHSLNVMIGNQSTGRWQKSGPFENPYVLARQLGEWLHNWKMPRLDDNNYAQAPKVRNISDGEALFRKVCSSCHGIGGTNTQLARLGPNLFGVHHRRERAWLERWITEPDKMLAEKDPIATQLFEAYNKVAMPNNRLVPEQVADLLQYIEEETNRVAATPMKITDENGEQKEALPSCCAKKKKAVIDSKGEAAAAAAAADTAKKADAGDTEGKTSHGMSTAGMASVGAGILLALATAFLRFARKQSA